MADNKKMHNSSSLRFRWAKSRAEKLGQIPTPVSIARLLALSVPRDARRILDLGAGNGALAASILERCTESRALLVDIDAGALRKLTDIPLARRSIETLDILRSPAVSQLRVDGERPDVIVSNPPYAMARLGQASIDRVRKIFPQVDDQGGWLRSDVVFAAHAWSLIAPRGAIALIVASPIVTQPAFASVRQQFITGLSELTVTQLASKTFDNAEVDAFLITGRRGPSRKRSALLRQCALDGSIIAERRVSYQEALLRMDFRYHDVMTTMNAGQRHVAGTLGTLGVTVTRGSRSRNEYAGLGFEAFHTSHFAAASDELHLTGGRNGFHNAHGGDLLLARVGSRCLGREAKVAAGSGLFTDCVFRLRVAREHQQRVWKTLSSDFGREWREAHAVGNCAKHITVATLMSMPVLA